MNRQVRFLADGSLDLTLESREEAHGQPLYSLPIVSGTASSDASAYSHLASFGPFGDVRADSFDVVAGPGRAGLGNRLNPKQPSDGERFPARSSTRSPKTDALGAQKEAWAQGEMVLSQEAAWALSSANNEMLPSAPPYWETAPSLRMWPIRSPTLPPASHTNAFFLGENDVLFIEPASADPKIVDAAVALCEAHRWNIVAVVLTHHHPDHTIGARAFAEAMNAPIWAHQACAARLPALTIERALVDGERLEIGGKTLRVLHTPGHAPGHLCFLDETSGVLICGDMAAGVGSILIEPGSGDMNAYWQQLERLATSGCGAVAPAHGGLIPDGRALFERTAAHRRVRDQKVHDALSATGQDVDTLLGEVYIDTPKFLWPYARLSLLAHLDAMRVRGVAAEEHGRWRRL